jgi:prepilin-type N-terminal cleavage/methylation domain-containing protein
VAELRFGDTVKGQIYMSNNPNLQDLEKQKGFTMIEAIIAIFIITIGLIGTAAAITYALEYNSVSRNSSNAKLIITASIEEIESLRNTRRLEYKQITNSGSVDNTDCPNTFNGFSNGYKDVSISPGPDGVNGTDDDLLNEGADLVYGTSDDYNDLSFARGGYTRQITITALSTTVKKIEVKVKYVSSGGKIGELRGVCYLNDDNRLTG